MAKKEKKPGGDGEKSPETPTAPRRQDLLYIQSTGTGLMDAIHGMSLVIDGEIIEPEPDDWPYATVLDAVRDSWRIIKFPEMALMLDESRTYGLGCEFILEKQ